MAWGLVLPRALSKKRANNDGADVPLLSVNIMEKDIKDGESGNVAVRTFTFRELEAATSNFKADNLLGGKVYKGRLDSINRVVAIKQLGQNCRQGNTEFLTEVMMLSLVHHINLVNLIGYCFEGDRRLLVYDYMPLGSLDTHLFGIPPDKDCLNWHSRIKIALGVAKGLEYLHSKANPPVIHGSLKCSNIILGDGFHPKLSDFGLAKLGCHVSFNVMGTCAYCAPEYALTGQVTTKSDIYSFGVVLLEIITGRKALKYSAATEQCDLLTWVRPLFNASNKLTQIADPLLQGAYPARGLSQALAIAEMCVQEQPNKRPRITDVVTALSYLAAQGPPPACRQHIHFASFQFAPRLI